MNIDELESSIPDCDQPCLPNPSVDEILALADLDEAKGDHERAGLNKAMREAVHKRIEGLTKRRRRNHYHHAAFLAAACVTIDKSDATSAWIDAIRSEYRRFPALQRELDQYLSQSRKHAPAALGAGGLRFKSGCPDHFKSSTYGLRCPT
jgi:hypothetical protein